MIAGGTGFGRVRAAGRHLPFASSTFDAALAVEVLEHVADLDPVLAELRRVLRPGGTLAILDKNAAALDARRPWLPAVLVKWIDERRGRWMYPPGAPVRERWFRPNAMARRLGRSFHGVATDYLRSPSETAAVFGGCPGVRRFVLWTARRPGGGDG
jgi:2-polyprenyl-6-hydroxyphenyl methylase/3-demethylubiquinone-9 3-methyltransferase